jgi:hypothetical protein
VDWDVVGSVITAVVFILTVGGVLILGPITKRLSEILELYARDRPRVSTATWARCATCSRR